jgi:hypothetical protein
VVAHLLQGSCQHRLLLHSACSEQWSLKAGGELSALCNSFQQHSPAHVNRCTQLSNLLLMCVLCVGHRASAADFTPQLLVYQPGSGLPSGAPGDPSRDYSRSRACGTFAPGAGVWMTCWCTASSNAWLLCMQ